LLNEPTVAYHNKLLPFCCQLVQALVTPLHSILHYVALCSRFDRLTKDHLVNWSWF